MSKPVADIIEDLEFLDSELVGAFEAAERTGFATAHALEKWLERHDAYDLWISLKKRDPDGAHWARKNKTKGDTVATHPLTALLDEAEASTVAKHRRKADRVRTLLAELKAELDADRDRREAQAEARAKVEQLQAELAAARQQLKDAAAGTKAKAAPTGPVASEVRTWALANNVACPRAGRVPNDVVSAYLAATNKQEAS